MRAYSMDIRKRALRDSDAGMSALDVAVKYRVSIAWVRRLKQRRREYGEIDARPSRNPRVPALADHGERITELVNQSPDATLLELREKLGLAVSVPTLWRALRDLKISFKKKAPTPRSRTARTSKTVASRGGPR